MKNCSPDEYADALAAERVAWEAVQEKLPGTPGYDARLWMEWRAATKACDSARKRLTNALLAASVARRKP